GPDLELKSLDSIFWALADRRSIAELERTDRRDPAQAQTGRRAQAVHGGAFRFTPDVAHVDVAEQAQGAIVAGTGHRQVELAVQIDPLAAAGVGARHVHRPERSLIEASHRTQAAAVEVLEDG